jgi:transposase
MFAGVDTHKDTLAVAVIDHAGRVVSQLELPNQDSGYARLLALLTSHNVVRVGIEGSGNFGWPAAIYLLKRDVSVVEVPPLMTSRERLSRPGQGKTDPVDAIAIARITAREDALPPVRPMTGHAADLRVLSEYRDQLVNERTATANRVHTRSAVAAARLPAPAAAPDQHLAPARRAAAIGRRGQRPGRGDSGPAGPHADPHRAAR